MIVRRFRSVGWVGTVAAAALCSYLVTQRVASERAHVEQLDRRILLARLDIRKLETELGTRSRLPVLEQWNQDVLALSAPGAEQYLHGEVQLARFEMSAQEEARVRQVSATLGSDSATSEARVIPVSTDMQSPASEPAPEEAGESRPMLRHANYVKPADGSLMGGARRVALLDEGVLSDLQQVAQREKRGPKSQR